ncbi:MAG: flagellar filament outer layer protein FlaA, partial [Spirochaetota bacterium]|nr:flagellar filament outer layer protein FlaA [Spirochaetota bacterium]
ENRDKKIADLNPTNTAEIDPKTLAPIYNIQATALLYNKWLVELNSSANTTYNRRWSYAKKVDMKAGKEFKGDLAEVSTGKDIRGNIGKGKYTLGVRIHFPKHKNNAYAKICPPYELRAYDDNGKIVSRKKEGKFLGIIDNVGDIKKISMDVSGRNFKNGIAVRLKDQYDEIKEYFLGYLYFANWRRLSWENSNYITSVDNRTLFRVPLYPQEVPYKKFDSIIIYRPYGELGGDFVAYFRMIDMWFDYAVPPENLADLDIDDEANWGILSKKARDRKRNEDLRAREQIELIRQEERKLGKNSESKDLVDLLKKEKEGEKQPTTTNP